MKGTNQVTETQGFLDFQKVPWIFYQHPLLRNLCLNIALTSGLLWKTGIQSSECQGSNTGARSCPLQGHHPPNALIWVPVTIAA